MQLKSCRINDKPGFKWGKQGKCFTYKKESKASKKNARKKAIEQGVQQGDLSARLMRIRDQIKRLW